MSLSGSPQLPPLTPEEAAETNLPRIMGITAVFHILALAFFVVRMYTRFVLVKAPKLDDAFMILATVCSQPWFSNGTMGDSILMYASVIVWGICLWHGHVPSAGR